MNNLMVSHYINGLTFMFYERSMLYKLIPRKIYAIDLICIVEGLFRYLNYINRKGFVSKESLYDSFMVLISKNLES